MTIAIATGGVVWLALVVHGFGALFDHASTPGAAPAPPPRWPASAPCALGRDRPTLLMFAHPRCPCTVASFGELARVMAKCVGRVDARVLIWSDPAHGLDAATSRAWAEAARIPGVNPQADPEGKAARVFRVTTSGSVALYAADGQLLFHGGITGSRGHEGDNPGASAVVALVHDPKARDPKSLNPTKLPAATAVFGCALMQPEGSPPR